MSNEALAKIGAWLALLFILLGVGFLSVFDWRLGIAVFDFIVAWLIIDLLPQPRR